MDHGELSFSQLAISHVHPSMLNRYSQILTGTWNALSTSCSAVYGLKTTQCRCTLWTFRATPFTPECATTLTWLRQYIAQLGILSIKEVTKTKKKCTSLAPRPMTVLFGLGTRLCVRMCTTLENGILRNRQQPGRAEDIFMNS